MISGSTYYMDVVLQQSEGARQIWSPHTVYDGCYTSSQFKSSDGRYFGPSVNIFDSFGSNEVEK
jgi:hypothetical protein